MKKFILSVFVLTSINAFADCPGLSVNMNTYNPSCSGACDGGGSIGISGGSGSYNINYYNSNFSTQVGTGTSVNNLCAGTFNVIVEDITNACYDTTQFFINNPMPLTGVITGQNNPTCNGSCNGSMMAVVTGGTAPYTFMWSGPNGFTYTAQMISGLCAGTYICYITDSGGCTILITGVLTQPAAISVTTSTTPATCGSSDGTALANVSGGVGGYTFSWSTGQTTNPANALSTGNYSVTVTDANGCIGTGNASVGSSGMAATATNVVMATCNQCNGSADIIVSGGTPSYTYLMDSIQNTTGIYTGLCPGVHIATVTDQVGCTTYYTLTIGSNQSGTMTATTTTVNETGFNYSDGSINLTVAGGLPPYTYQWSNGAITEDIYSLTAGTYGVWVTDQNGDCNYFTAVISTVQSFGTITGIVYNDYNTNCIYDAGDVLLSGQWVQAGPYWGYSNAMGQYTITVQAGNYNVQPGNVTNITSGCQTSQLVTVTNGGTVTADFSLNIPPVYNVCVNAYSLGIVPGFSGTYTIYAYNTGNMTANGDICFVLPSDLDYTGCTPAPVSISGDTICWSYTNLLPGQYMSFSVLFLTPASLPLGTPETACLTSEVTNGTASNPACGQVCYTRLVTGSFDPNEKSVSPTGEGPTGDIQLTEDEFTYLIQFQNTGTGPAVNITVTDTLSSLLDLTTFEMLNSSHNYEVDFFNGNIIRWKFENINLPDSGSNETLSHGHVQFKIRTLNAPSTGQVINNTANIYFDFNAPVITNTTINTYVMPTGVNEINSGQNISVYPNPASSHITIVTSVKTGKNIPVRITDITGRKVGEITLAGNSVSTDISGYEPGIYFITATVDGKLNTIPFVISK